MLNALLKDRILFNKFYASCDLIEDTENAIDYYKNSDFTEKCLGEKYILLYGLFEAFYIQYDAAKKLVVTAIELIKDEQIISKNDFKEDYDKLDKIKEYRNDIASHSAYRGSGSTGYSVYLSQYNLSKEKVEYQKSHTQEFTQIDILQGIEMQEKSILNILNKIFEKLKIKEEEHYKKYKDEKLYSIFSKYYTYPREKIFNDDKLQFSIDLLKKLSDDIKQKLNERYVDYKDLDFSYLVSDIDDIMDFLENRLGSLDIDSRYKNFIKKNMIENLTNKFDNLMDIFKEIDKKYEDYFNPQEEKETVMHSITIIDDIPKEKEAVNAE